MTHKHLTTLVILTVFVIPITSFAKIEFFSAKEKSPKKEESAEVVKISKEQKDFNRKERILHAVNAMESNIAIVEKAINQTTIRINGIDKNSDNYKIANGYLEKAKNKLSEAKAVISVIKTTVNSIDTTNTESIKIVQNNIETTKKATRESIDWTKKSIQVLKRAKLLPKNVNSSVTVTEKNNIE